jgi:uncharacterized membrane protein YcaP (DUF421 family)
LQLLLTPADLERPDVLRSQRREFVVERAGWGLMGILLLAGAWLGYGHTVLRAGIIYLALLVIFRVAGKRTLSDVTTFDFILLLIISESIQQGLVEDYHALGESLLLVVTLVALNILFSELKLRFPRVDRVTEGLPVLIYSKGTPHRDVMKRERIGEEDIMHAARSSHGLESLQDVEFAILEASGGISVIPRKDSR